MNLSQRRAIASVFFLFAQPAWCAFQDVNWGARPVGMGGAFTAIADDTNAPLYNPAGMVQVQWNELSAMYSRLFSGETLYAGQDTVRLDQSHLAYVSRPIPKIGTLGVSWSNFTTTHLYKEDTVTLSYARNVGDFVTSLENDLAAGLNLKYLRRSVSLDTYTTADPVFSNGNSASGFTVDFGLLYKPEEGPLSGWRLGVSGQNLTQPDVGFRDKDEVPALWRFGTAYQSKQLPWLVPALDFTLRDSVVNVQGGIESWLFQDTLGLRAGGNRQEAAAGISYYYAATQKLGFRLDYGITIPFYVEDTSGSHRLALTLYF
jgi:hypothetical protein